MRLFPLLLIPLFFILHGVNENYGLIPFRTITQLVTKYLAISIGVYLLSSLMLRNPEKKFLFAFYLLSLYFFFGAFHDLLKDMLGQGFLVSYKFILPLLLVITILICFLLRRNKKSFVKPVRYLGILMILFVTWELLSAGINLVKGGHKRNDLSSGKDWFGDSGKDCDALLKPDIFFIVLDGYTSSNCLKEQFGYDNFRMDSLLRASGFYISDSSRSNYNVTPFSLASTFNMDYMKKGIENNVISSRVFMRSELTMKKSGLAPFLRSRGYEVMNFGCFELDEAPLEYKKYFHGNAFRQIDGQTLSSRIQKDIWWNFSLKNIFRGTFRVPGSYTREKEYHIYRNVDNFANFAMELKKNESKPRFVYCHVMIPHEPFYLREDGSYVSDTSILTNSLDQKKAYINQLKYVNKWLADILPLKTAPDGRQRVVIVEGDHGYRFYEAGIPKEREFMNLNAYYFSDGDTTQLYKGISPVNTFRVVMNKYFCKDLPMLPDSSIYLINNQVLLGK